MKYLILLALCTVVAYGANTGLTPDNVQLYDVNEKNLILHAFTVPTGRSTVTDVLQHAKQPFFGFYFRLGNNIKEGTLFELFGSLDAGADRVQIRGKIAKSPQGAPILQFLVPNSGAGDFFHITGMRSPMEPIFGMPLTLDGWNFIGLEIEETETGRALKLWRSDTSKAAYTSLVLGQIHNREQTEPKGVFISSIAWGDPAVGISPLRFSPNGWFMVGPRLNILTEQDLINMAGGKR